MSFRIYTDGIFGGVQHTAEEPDDIEVFATFGEARRALGRMFTARAAEYRAQARWARALTLDDVEEAS
jgi:hypothetical protein